MAKKKVAKKGPNKTKLIQAALNESPNASPKEIAERLSGKGVKISAAYVSTIKSTTLKRDKKTASRPKSSKAKNGHVTVDALVNAKSFADKAGGVDEAKKILDVLSQLQ